MMLVCGGELDVDIEGARLARRQQQRGSAHQIERGLVMKALPQAFQESLSVRASTSVSAMVVLLQTELLQE